MRKNKKYIAYAILIGFLVAIAPRTFFHDCHDHSGFLRKEYSKQSIEEKDCDFCSYHIGDVACTTTFQFNSVHIIPIIAQGLPVKSSERNLGQTRFFRGPPVC